MSEYTYIGDDKPAPQDERYNPDERDWTYDGAFGQGWDEAERMEQMQQQSPEPQDYYEPGERARMMDRDYLGSGPSADDAPDDTEMRIPTLTDREARLYAEAVSRIGSQPWDMRIFGYEPGMTIHEHHDNIRQRGRRDPESYVRVRERERRLTHAMESAYRDLSIKTRRDRAALRAALKKTGWI